jgi:hypothetical protein
MVTVLVAPLLTVCAVLGLMLPFVPAVGVTVQVCFVAEQLAVVPPFIPVQLQYQGPVPVTVVAVPVVQRLLVGVAIAGVPLLLPQTPLARARLKVAVMLWIAVTLLMVKLLFVTELFISKPLSVNVDKL